MKGTEKQIAWAEDIKSKFISVMEAPEFNSDPNGAKVCKAFAAAIESIDYAGTIIDMFKDAGLNGDHLHDFGRIMSEFKVNRVARQWYLDVFNSIK